MTWFFIGFLTASALHMLIFALWVGAAVRWPKK